MFFFLISITYPFFKIWYSIILFFSMNIKFLVEELSEIKRVSNGQLRLLGFKPLSCLKDYHNLRPSTFIFPTDQVALYLNFIWHPLVILWKCFLCPLFWHVYYQNEYLSLVCPINYLAMRPMPPLTDSIRVCNSLFLIQLARDQWCCIWVKQESCFWRLLSQRTPIMEL